MPLEPTPNMIAKNEQYSFLPFSDRKCLKEYCKQNADFTHIATVMILHLESAENSSSKSSAYLLYPPQSSGSLEYNDELQKEDKEMQRRHLLIR